MANSSSTLETVRHGFLPSDLDQLVQPQAEPAVSIFMPCTYAGRQQPQYSALLRSVIERATRLVAQHATPEASEAIQATLWHFYQTHTAPPACAGLALFVTPEVFHAFAVPFELDEHVVLNTQFYIRPLLPLIVDNGVFFMLALGLDGNRLLRCTRWTMEEVPVPGAPANLAETLQYDDWEKQHQMHPGIPGNSGERGPIFHGQGDRSDVSKNEIVRYFRAFEHAARHVIGYDHTPLVLCGLEHHVPLYRAVNTYPYLATLSVNGNPDSFDGATLRDRAWQIVRPVFQQDRLTRFSQYQQLAGTGLTSTKIGEILTAARQGRVDTLFMRCNDQIFAAVEDHAPRAYLNQPAQPGMTEMINLAAIETIKRHGVAYESDDFDTLSGTPVVAIFRY